MNSYTFVVDDDPALAEIIGIVLGSKGLDAATCLDGAQALDVFHQENPDPVLLGIVLPDMDGIEICTRIHRESDMPVVMLTARTDIADAVAGFKARADDYVPRLLRHRELVVRVRARLQRREEAVDKCSVLSDLVTDVSGHTIHRGGEEILLTPLELDLLVALGCAPQGVFSRRELLEKVWGYRHATSMRLVNVHMQRLRSKIE